MASRAEEKERRRQERLAQEEADRKATARTRRLQLGGRGAAGGRRDRGGRGRRRRGRRDLVEQRAVAVGLGELERQAAGAQDHRSRHGGEGGRLRREVVPARGPRPHRRRRSPTTRTRRRRATTTRTRPRTASTPTARRRRSATSTRSSTAASRCSGSRARRRTVDRHPAGDLQRAAQGQVRLPRSCSSRTTRACRSRSPPPSGSTTSAARSGTRRHRRHPGLPRAVRGQGPRVHPVGTRRAAAQIATRSTSAAAPVARARSPRPVRRSLAANRLVTERGRPSRPAQRIVAGRRRAVVALEPSVGARQGGVGGCRRPRRSGPTS